MRWLWKAIYAWIEEYFILLYYSIGYIQSNEHIWGEDKGNTCGRKDSMLTEKEVPLCCGHNKIIAKIWTFDYLRTHRKTTSPWRNNQ